MENILLLGGAVYRLLRTFVFKPQIRIDPGEWTDDQELQRYVAELSAYSLERLRTLISCIVTR